MPSRLDLPPLAQYRQIDDWVPAYGDYVVWAGWFTTWHGVVGNYDSELEELSIIFAGVPFLLFTLDKEEQEKETRKIKLTRIRQAAHGTFAVNQHDYKRNATIWFI